MIDFIPFNDVSPNLIGTNEHLDSVTPARSPIQAPRGIVTSTCTTSPITSAGNSRSHAGSILPCAALALGAQRVPRCNAHVIMPRNPPSVVLACNRSRDIRAKGIHADIVGSADVAVRVSGQDSPIQEVGGKAVSASVWRWYRIIRMSMGNYRGVGRRQLSISQQ